MSARPKRTRPEADEAGALEAMQGVASQALPIEIIPTDDASPEIWASYVNSARGKAAEAVVEWGRRVAAAHTAYRAQGQRWGQTWDDWCRDNLGIGKQYADKLRLIGQNLPLTKRQILPAATDQLVALARLNRDYPAAFEDAAATGAITPGMTRVQTQQLLTMARAEQPRTALPAAPAPFRRVAGVTLETALADKLEAIATARGRTPAQLLAEAAEAWLRRQPIPEGAVTVDTTVRLSAAEIAPL